MLRIAYALTVTLLVGATAVAASSMESRQDRLGERPELVLLRIQLAG